MRMWIAAALVAVMQATAATAQDKPPELTRAGKAILQDRLAVDGRPLFDRPGPSKPITFPLAMCTFPGGLCGAVRRDGSVAVPPKYDWVGEFSNNRAAVRLRGLYGFVDEEGRDIVSPQYRIVDDYYFGFAQVDVDGKSGLIDRDGKMVIEPRYGFIRAIAPDRFAVSEHRRLGGRIGAEDFSDGQVSFTPSGGMSISSFFGHTGTDVIDLSGTRIGPVAPTWTPGFDRDDATIRWVQRDRLWGLERSDGSWLIEPKFQDVGSLIDGLARVVLNGKAGFIDRNGSFGIEPIFDGAGSFERGIGRAWAKRDGVLGVIDRTGTWVFQTGAEQIYAATRFGQDRTTASAFGWQFRKADRWGLFDLDGRIVLDAEFSRIQRCDDDRLVAYRDKEPFYFKADGTPLQPPEGQLIDATCGTWLPFVLKVGDKFGLVDTNFKALRPVHFDAIASVAPGIKNVKIDDKWGRVDVNGRWLLQPGFDYLSRDADIFAASIDGKRGFMRFDGSWLIQPKFDAAARRQDKETAFVTLAGATGAIYLTDQSWVVPPRPGVMCDVGNAIMLQADGKRSILSRTGESWIDIGAERISISVDVGLLTFLKDGKWGLVDSAGQVMVEPTFDEPVYFSNRGVAWAKRDGGRWCAVDRRGHLVPAMACHDANPMGPGSRFECKVEP